MTGELVIHGMGQVRWEMDTLAKWGPVWRISQGLSEVWLGNRIWCVSVLWVKMGMSYLWSEKTVH